ncbi:MAG: hypothetical protein AB8B50_03695 [Pirellulaceae bacterium]
MGQRLGFEIGDFIKVDFMVLQPADSVHVSTRPFVSRLVWWAALVTSAWWLIAGPVGFRAFAQEASIGQRAQDVVYFGPENRTAGESSWGTPVPTRYQGSILKFDDSELVIETKEGERRVPSKRVERVEFEWANNECRQAMQALTERDYRSAYQSLTAQLKGSGKEGVPPWQNHFLISGAIRATEAMGEVRVAGKLLEIQARNRPPQLLLADMPLCWTARSVPSGVREEVPRWLASEADSVRLLGASWGLFNAEDSLAKRTLTQLKTSNNQAVALLAAAQSWRLVPPPETLQALPNWFRFRDAMLPDLQLGPTEFIADRLQRINEPKLALGQLHRIASEHSDRYHRAEAALKQAASIFLRAGLTEEADKVDRWLEDL